MAIAVIGAAGLLVLAIVLLVRASGHDPRVVLADPNAIAHQSFFFGAISTLGVMGWAAAAMAALLGFFLARTPQWRRFFVLGGLLVLSLGLDDAFLVHDEVLPTHLGVDEKALLVVWAALGLLWVVLCREQIQQPTGLMLLLALTCLAGSVIIDQLTPGSSWDAVLEDGLKFAGIVLMATYLARTAILVGRSGRA